MSDLKVVSFTPKESPKSASKFKTGDKVKLKSDPQHATVQHADKDGVTVKWTSDIGEPQTETYLEDMLEFVPPPKPPRKRRPKVMEIVFTPDPKPRTRKMYSGKGAK